MLSNKDSGYLMGIPIDKFTTGINLLVIAVSVVFFVIILMVVIAVKCRTKRIKKKNSMCEEDGQGYAVNSGILKPNIMNIKRTLSDDNSESSDDILFDTDRKYVIDRVQPKRTSLRSQSSIDSDSDGVPSIVVSVLTEGESVSFTIIKAKNLRRSGFCSTDKLIPEGVFARIYPKTRALSTDSSQTESEHNANENTEYFETSLVRSRKSRFIKFNESQSFCLNTNWFPIRLSVYELDKHKVRYNIGHTFLTINARDSHQTNQVVELDLFSTVDKARNAYLRDV